MCAECIRLAFKAGNVAFEDVRFEREEWASTYKETSPSGQCPMLKVNGRTFVESNAILAYAAIKAGIMPTDAEEQMAVWQAILAVESLYTHLMPVYKATPDEKAKVVAEQAAEIAKSFKHFEKIVTSNDNGKSHKFLVGDSFTASDAAFFGFLTHATSPFMGLTLDFSGSPFLESVVKNIREYAPLKEYIATIPMNGM